MKGEAGRGAQLVGGWKRAPMVGDPRTTLAAFPREDSGLGWGLWHWAWGQWRQGGLHVVFLLG